MMLMKDIMTRTFETLGPRDTLKNAARLFRETRLDALPVVEAAGGLIGIMTKANFYDAISSGLSPEAPVEGLFIKDVMTLSHDLSYDEVKDIVRTSHAGNSVILDDNKDITGIFTKAGWIMAMLKNEAQLRNQLQVILDTMHNGLVVVDEKGHVRNINKAAAEILHADVNACLKGPLSQILPGLDICEVVRGGEASVGLTHSHGDLNLLCNITPVVREGSISGAIIVFQDLTELIKVINELQSVTKHYETLQSVMDFAYDGIIVADEKGRISMVNQAAARFFKKRVDKMVGRPIEDIIENSSVKRVIATGVPEINRLQFIRGIPYVVSSSPIMRKGRVVGAVGKILFRNLDEIQDLAKKLGQVNKELLPFRDRVLGKGSPGAGFSRIVTADPEFMLLIEEAEIVARGTSNILITGQSGTGKELIAEAIHYASSFSSGHIIKVNCSAIPDSLMESEFFGYVKGAFTGAVTAGKKGKLALAHGGTLFLDEIGDMPLALQGKLLRVIQDRCFEPVGSNVPVEVDVRFIAATNRDLSEMVNKGLFRSDLFYRLNVIHLHIPPLCERKADIPLLVQYFLDKYNRIFSTNVRKASNRVEEVFVRHSWPGNVRELENVIERAINFARGDSIDMKGLPGYLRDLGPIRNNKAISMGRDNLLRPSRQEHERQIILDALNEAGGNKALAAKKLGISRSWLYEKMSKLGIKPGP